MKKLATLFLAAGMVVASTAPANAVDIKVDGMYRHSFAVGEEGAEGANFESMLHRLRLGVTMAASENLSAYVQFQINHGNQYGVTTNKHGNTGSYAITARQLYLDWTIPGTAAKVRMGRFGLGLPGDAFGDNSVLAASWGNREGVAVTLPVNDWLGLSAMWTRMGAANGADDDVVGGPNLDQASNTDVFAAVANMKFDGFSGAVYAAYAAHDGYGTSTTYAEDGVKWNKGPLDEDGEQTYTRVPGVWYKSVASKLNSSTILNLPNYEGDAYWLGFTSTFSAFDPFTLKLSAAYGEFNARNAGDANESGWNVQAKASYALPFGTATFGGWYFSGADKEGKGIMPTAGGYHTATMGYFDGSSSLEGMQGYQYVTGQWAIQAGLEGMSFIDNLSHTFKVTYMQGTNEVEGLVAKGYTGDKYLTDEESIVEFNLLNTYQIYKNLAAHLEFVYMITDYEDGADKFHDGMTEDDWSAQLTFQYKF